MRQWKYVTKGFSLFEVVLGITLTAIVLTVALPWVVNLITTTSHNLDSDQTRRNLDTAVSQMVLDAGKAAHCGGDSAIYQASANQVSWFVRDGEVWGNTTPKGTLVSWKITPEGLLRSEIRVQDECVTGLGYDPYQDPALRVEQLFPGQFEAPLLFGATRDNLLNSSRAELATKAKTVIALDITNPATKAVFSAREVIPTP